MTGYTRDVERQKQRRSNNQYTEKACQPATDKSNPKKVVH
jgi:hypothetical protein